MTKQCPICGTIPEDLKKHIAEHNNDALKLIVDEEISRLEDKYEIETLEPNVKIENWFEEFEKDINNIIKNALKLKEKNILEKLERIKEELKADEEINESLNVKQMLMLCTRIDKIFSEVGK